MADHSHTFFVMVVVFHWLFLLRFPLALNFHQSVTNLHTINQQQQADEATRIKQATSLIGKIFPIFFFCSGQFEQMVTVCAMFLNNAAQ